MADEIHDENVEYPRPEHRAGETAEIVEPDENATSCEHVQKKRITFLTKEQVDFKLTYLAKYRSDGSLFRFPHILLIISVVWYTIFRKFPLNLFSGSCSLVCSL
jgi:hypothetical protein